MAHATCAWVINPSRKTPFSCGRHVARLRRRRRRRRRRTRPRAIPLAMLTMRKLIHGFPLPAYTSVGLRPSCRGPKGHESSTIRNTRGQIRNCPL